MDFDEFEQLVLKVLFETDVPITAAHVAYLGRVSVRTAERHLARMVEHGTLTVRTRVTQSAEGVERLVRRTTTPRVPRTTVERPSSWRRIIASAPTSACSRCR